MIVLRAHYTMDMIAAVIFAHYFWLMGDRYSYLVDWKLLKIPLYKRMAYYKPENEEKLMISYKENLNNRN